jgi:phage regulator Rha-like protein
MPKALSLVPTVESIIRTIRNQRVILDSDLAALYGVPTGRLNEAVKRNAERFPEEFMFQLTKEESDSLRSQFATLKTGRGQHRKYAPFAFTEHGALMAATVLNSPQAIAMSVAIIKAFVKLRQLALSIGELSQKVAALENGFLQHDQQLESVFDAIRQLLAPPETPTKEIGFHTKD